MRTITKKILAPFADAILSGEKTFEIRSNNDEGYQKGDVIVFKVMDSEYFESISHPLSGAQYEITYVLSGWGLAEGYVALGIKPIAQAEWIENDNGTWSCSKCQSWIPKEQHHYARYCLHCGAKMKERVEL